MYKIGVIGDRESILGFKAVGLTVFPCDEAEEAKKIYYNLDILIKQRLILSNYFTYHIES